MIPTYTGNQPLIHTFNILSLITSTFLTAAALLLTNQQVLEYFTVYYLEAHPINVDTISEGSYPEFGACKSIIPCIGSLLI